MTDIIATGHSASGIHVVCNDAGLYRLPMGIHEYHDGDGDLHNGVLIPITEANLMALRMVGALSDTDTAEIRRKYLNEPLTPTCLHENIHKVQ